MYLDESGCLIAKQVIRYLFTGEEHPLPKLPHGNSSGSTPYKRQLKSTRDLLKVQAEESKPREAVREVEKQLCGIDEQISTSSLPRNTQQTATIRSNLFQGQAHSDPIMGLVDMHKTGFNNFIRALQILPTPACVLATDEQLDQLVLNCTQEKSFGVMHVDPTFNLGDFFVTPIVFPLVNYVHRKTTGGCPTFIGPVLLHHQMQHTTYSYFLNQIISLKPAVRNTKAVGTDGELALCNALKDNLPGAVGLRCLKHVKDSIEWKLNDLKFDSQSSCVVVADIFGHVVDGVHELGLSDATDKNDFFKKLMALENKWNDILRKHCHFLAQQQQNPVFYGWFCTNYSKVFSENIIQSVRERAGLGKPPQPFYINRSESMNKIIKQHVHHKNSALPVFVKHLYTLIEEQNNFMKKAGDWRLKDQALPEPTKQLSCSNDCLVEYSTIDKGILDSIWEKAAHLAYSEVFITRIPGDFEGKGRMVASSNSQNPHMVTVGRKNNSTFHCDRHCPRYASYKFYAHTIAVAEVNGCLSAFIKGIKKSKLTTNMSKLAYHGLQG